MRIATWNVNSIRTRVDRVIAFLERGDVDVLAMQETKCKDEQFPMARFEEAGYEVAHHGLNQWNGVAIASRVGLEDVQIGFEDMPGFGDPIAAEARAIAATCDGMRMWSLYVPNGREIGHPHYEYKLDWLAALRADGETAEQKVEAWIEENRQSLERVGRTLQEIESSSGGDAATDMAALSVALRSMRSLISA